MIERFAIVLLFAAIVLLLGFTIQRAIAARSRRLASAAPLFGTPVTTPRLLVFTSRWCSDCATQHALIERLQQSWHEPVEVSYYDAVTESEVAMKYGIMMVPALVVARASGEIVGVRQGLVDEDRLRSLLEAAA